MYARYRLRTNHLYSVIDNDGLCVYCGERSDCLDHFVPVSLTFALSATGIVPTGKVLLQSCRECNAHAGSYVFKTVSKKRKYIHERLADKYRYVFDMPSWKEDELSELGYALRKFVELGRDSKEWLTRRLKWRNKDNPAFAKIASIHFIQLGGHNSFAPPGAERSIMPRIISRSKDPSGKDSKRGSRTCLNCKRHFKTRFRIKAFCSIKCRTDLRGSLRLQAKSEYTYGGYTCSTGRF